MRDFKTARIVMIARHGIAQIGCLLAMFGCVESALDLFSIDVNNTMFNCNLCMDYIHCASRFATRYDDIPCDQIGMNVSQVVRPDGSPLTFALQWCNLPLPEVDGTAEYWIERSSRCDCHRISNTSSMFYADHQSTCSSGRFPFICEKYVGSDWWPVNGRLYRRLSVRLSLCNAEQACHNNGGELANMTGVNITNLGYGMPMRRDHKAMDIWVKSTGTRCNISTSNSLHVNARRRLVSYRVTNTQSHLYALCEKIFIIDGIHFPGPPSTATQTLAATACTTTSIASTALAVTEPTNPPHTPTVAKSVPPHTSTGWIIDNQREFYVNRNQSNFTEATDACTSKMNASMVFFTDPLKYLDMSQSLGLPAEHFWVGVAVNDSHHKCLQLRVGQNSDAFLSRADCLQMAASICSRTPNVSDVLENPTFSRLLAEMSVDSSDTQKSKRKLVSVYDKRKSAMTVGSIGVIAVISVFTLIALLDLTRLKCRCKYDDSKKTKVKVTRTRKASERGAIVTDKTSV